MAGLPSNNGVDAWAPESELREAPPRRFEPRSDEFPDLNQPSKILFLYVGGAILVVGLALLIYGLGHKQHPVIPVLGSIMAVAGALLVAVYPVRLKSHMSRAEQLISFGVPVIARILSVDNMTGDSTYARMVKYQVVLPGGDMAHRTVNADERLLPSRVPADATALMDMATSDVELYCALPYKAADKPEAVSRIPVAPTPSYSAPSTVVPMPSATFSAQPMPQPTGSMVAMPMAEPAGSMGAMPTLGGGQMGSIGTTPSDRLPSDRLPSDRLPSDRLPSDRLPSDRLPSPPPAAEPSPVREAPAATPPPADKPAGPSGLPWE